MIATYQNTRTAIQFAEMLVTGAVDYAPRGWKQATLEAALDQELARIDTMENKPEELCKFVAAARYVTGRGYVGNMSRKAALDSLSRAKVGVWR